MGLGPSSDRDVRKQWTRFCAVWLGKGFILSGGVFTPEGRPLGQLATSWGLPAKIEEGRVSCSGQVWGVLGRWPQTCPEDKTFLAASVFALAPLLLAASLRWRWVILFGSSLPPCLWFWGGKWLETLLFHFRSPTSWIFRFRPLNQVCTYPCHIHPTFRNVFWSCCGSINLSYCESLNCYFVYLLLC